jgi:queuine tRNA-ribosyltransferase
MNWKGLVASDSGGFQVMSLVHAGKIAGKIVDDGIEMRISKNKKEIFTPEKSIQMQFAIGSDIMFVLDDCPSNGADKNEVTKSVERTIAWAKRSRVEFDRQVKERKLAKDKKPLLFGVVQGANFLDLRQECEEKLIEIGFDGFGFGGWPVDENNKLNKDALKLVAKLAPDNYLLFGLGIGKPENIVDCAKLGYHIFDCVLPTRDARHGRLYVFQNNKTEKLVGKNFYDYVYLSRGKYEQDLSPIETGCDCLTCQQYSRAYITHLFKIEDSLAWRLCTIHNLRFYARLMEKLKEI